MRAHKVNEARVESEARNALHLTEVGDQFAMSQLEDEFIAAFAALSRIKSVSRQLGIFPIFEAAYVAENYTLRALSFWEDT